MERLYDEEVYEIVKQGLEGRWSTARIRGSLLDAGYHIKLLSLAQVFDEVREEIKLLIN